MGRKKTLLPICSSPGCRKGPSGRMTFEAGEWGLQQVWSGGPGWGNGAFLWLGVGACAGGGRADGLLTLPGYYCPLPRLKKGRGPWGLGRCGHQLSGFKKLKQKNLSGISLQASGAGKTSELEGEVCQRCSLGARTASAAAVTRRCLPTGQRRGSPMRAVSWVTGETSPVHPADWPLEANEMARLPKRQPSAQS